MIPVRYLVVLIGLAVLIGLGGSFYSALANNVSESGDHGDYVIILVMVGIYIGFLYWAFRKPNPGSPSQRFIGPGGWLIDTQRVAKSGEAPPLEEILASGGWSEQKSSTGSTTSEAKTPLERLLSAARYLLGRWPVLVHDGLAVLAAWLGAYWFRFNLNQIPDIFLEQAIAMLPIVLVWHLAFFVIFGVHRGAWCWTSTHDLSVILKSVLVGTGVVAATIFFITGQMAVPRAIFPLHGLFLIGLLIGTRIVYRLFRDNQVRRGKGWRVLIVGAGAAGVEVLKGLGHDQELHYDVVGFIDDDQSKIGREIQGVKVLDSCAAIPELARILRIEAILIAVPSASEEEIRLIVEYCRWAPVAFSRLQRSQMHWRPWNE
jgi:hypothetical protein